MVTDNALVEMSVMGEDDLLELARDITNAGLDAGQLVKEFQAMEDDLP